MCLILFAYRRHARYRLVMAANRDEFYDRPSAPMVFWEEFPDVLAGRDLKSMGTWMGVTRSGKVAAVTNYREPGKQIPDAPSRGRLISDYLTGDTGPAAYLAGIQTDARRYNGFNLVVGDAEQLYYYSNRGAPPVRLEPGIFGLSNRLLDTDWPKVSYGKQRLTRLMHQNPSIPAEELLELLQSQEKPPDEQLPDTGVGLDWERTLSPLFITSPNYGTRCSTVLTIDRSNHVRVTEVTWKAAQSKPEPHDRRTYAFPVKQRVS